MFIEFDTFHKLKIFVWILGIGVAIAEILVIRQFLSDLNNTNLINILGSILLIVLPFILGYYYWEYRNQRNAINELCEAISELWDDAKEFESKANNKQFLEENEIFNSDLIYKNNCLQKEVSLLYILGFYFDNLKWYNHQLYNLPINFKQKIRWLCKSNLEFGDIILRYNSISFEEFSRSGLLPIQYGYYNTNPILKEFFEFLISNVDGNYSILNEILTDLNNVKIEYVNLNGEKCYF
ncbi:hypothetical protein [uncultured Methanobrevibacter sp.]|uniref:hypothetical protein n=1 Tax=uncultured Methanobrevibacter sp. TaxID=253161 RepID=UPI0025FEB0E9|nr:hypothetical protein [uncultured Methanobrevibacter sp.]